ncbi:MAG: hypothetical protein J5590_02190 [Clostridia bacterium]|nr:hypothetical protein [Clostridia bacterium]
MTAVLYLYLTAFFFYSSTNIVMLCLTSMIGIIISMASFYVFPLIVTFDMPLKTVFKNSLLFAFINLPQNLLVLILLILINIFLMLKFPIWWIILIVFFLIAFSSYTINFVAWNAISKHTEV